MGIEILWPSRVFLGGADTPVQKGSVLLFSIGRVQDLGGEPEIRSKHESSLGKEVQFFSVVSLIVKIHKQAASQPDLWSMVL